MSARRDRLLRTLLDDIAESTHRGKFYSARRIARLWPVSRPTVEAAVAKLLECGVLRQTGPRSLGVAGDGPAIAREVLQNTIVASYKPLSPRNSHHLTKSTAAADSSLDVSARLLPADDKAPLYEHLIKTLLIELASGAHPEHQRFLSRHRIQTMWQVSAPTASSATRYLLTHGLIEKHNARIHRVCEGAIQKARLLLARNPLPPLPSREDWLRKRALLLKGERTEGCRLAAILDEPRVYWESIRTLPTSWTLSDSRTQVNAQWYVFSFMQEAHRHFSSVTFLHDDGSAEATQKIQASIANERFDGIAVFQRKQTFPRRPLLAALKRHGIPVITVFDDCEGEADLSVDFNEAAGGYEAMKRLLTAGHRSILIFTRTRGFRYDKQRLTGARTCVNELGLEAKVRLHYLDFSVDKRPQRTLSRLLKDRNDRPTAMLVGDVGMFIRAEKTLSRIGIRIPADLSVITFGSAYTLPKFYRPLDLMERNLALIGQTAAQALIQMVDSNPVERTIQIAIDYLPRGTIRAPQKKRSAKRPSQR